MKQNNSSLILNIGLLLGADLTQTILRRVPAISTWADKHIEPVRLPVLQVFPLVLCILPALLVVVINEMIPIAVRGAKRWAGVLGACGFVFSAAMTWASGG